MLIINEEKLFDNKVVESISAKFKLCGALVYN